MRSMTMAVLVMNSQECGSMARHFHSALPNSGFELVYAALNLRDAFEKVVRSHSYRKFMR